MSNSQNDPLVSQAFTLALLQVAPELPHDLQVACHRVGEAVKVHQPGLDEQIWQLVDQHDRLKQLYTEAYDRLEAAHHTRERTKSYSTYRTSQVRTTTLTWEQVTAPILTADDLVLAARDLLKHWMAEADKASDDIQIFLICLQQTVATVDAQAIAILKALEKRPLTVKDLVYTVGLSLEKTQAIVQSLWNEGYIDRLTGNLLHNIFPGLKSKRKKQQPVDLDTSLTLTSKGHFLLHPVISFSRKESAIW